jgi:hypothetical protein
MSKPIRRHYLPQAYLSGFCADGRFLWLYDRARDDYRRQTPINTAVIGHYYSVTDEKGQQRTDLETELMQFVDSNGVSAIAAAQSQSALSSEARAKLAVFCAFLKFRIPDFEKSFNHLNEELLKWISRMTFCTPEHTAALISSYKADTKDDAEFDVQALTEFVLKGNYRIETSRAWSLENMIRLSQGTAPLMEAMDWCFYRPAPGKTFVTCDNPFVLVPPANWKPGAFCGFGLCTKGTKKIVPLAHDLCLIMYDAGGATFWRTATREETRCINLTVTDNCHAYVIARDEALIRSLVKTTNISRREWKPSISMR